MSQYRFTVALNAADAPPVTRFQPRSIVLSGLDNKLKNPATTNQNNLDNNPQGVPQVLYMENIVPTDMGVMSVGYESVQAAFPAAGNTGDDVYVLRDVDENRWYFSPAKGYNYVTSAWGVAWVSIDPLAGRPISNDFSIAYVNGITYICYANTYIGHWDGAVGNFIDDTGALTGVVVGDIRAILGSGNYLILLCADNSVKWSSLVDALDFVPDVSTGAGSQIPVDIRGAVRYGTPVPGGFLIHCQDNTVAAVYTQNSAQPWIFREVKNAGGMTSPTQVAKESGSGTAYMWNSNGLQALTLRDSENIHPNITDFLGGRVLEAFSSITKLLTISKVSSIAVKLAFLSGRYLTISYGSSSATYSYALIYDTALKRWGKLKVDHIDLFSRGADPAKESLYAMNITGVVNRIVLDSRTQTDTGVLILGRYQVSRSHNICSQELECEVLDDADDFTVTLAVNYNGTTVGQAAAMTLSVDTDNYRKFQKQLEGVNVSYILEGTFSLSTALITASKGAKQ